MKRLLSLCLCMAIAAGLLSGCDGATISDVQSVQKAGAAVVSDSLRGSLKNALAEVHKKFPRPKDAVDEGRMKSELYDTYKKFTKPIDGVTENMSNLERAKAVFLKMDIEDGNALYSPMSLEMALGLLSEGGSGETRDQILTFLGSQEGYAETAETVLKHADEITTSEPDGETDDIFGGYKTALNIANSLWVSDRYSLKSDFLGVSNKSYDATSQTLNFGKPLEAVQTVNAWCADKTKGLIKGILTSDMITPDLALVLCNSVYFESGWWEPWNVRNGKFTNADGKVTELPDMLYSTESSYYETDNAIAFSKRYISGSTFVGILQNEGVGLADIDLDALIASKTDKYDVHASMPKLNYDYSYTELVRALSECGVVNAFTPDAQLDGLVNESADIYVSDVLQKCKIELDENGTKAAAVTAMIAKDNAVMVEESTPVKEVHLNRPFYYMIMDGDNVLFIGAVNEV